MAAGLLSKGMDTARTAIAADGTPIHYQDLGPIGGRAVLLLHGLMANGSQFAADAAYFAEAGYRVLVPDVRGHGRSGKPEPLTAERFTIPIMADDMLAVLDHAGVQSVDWVGNSLGGILALELMGRAAERLTTVALFGTAFRLGLPRLAADAIPLTYRVLGRKLTAGITGAMTVRGAEERALVTKMLADFDPKVGWAAAENVRRYDLTANALGYGGPMLLLRGGRDRQVNLALKASLPVMNRLPNFTLVHLMDGGHCANLDVPEAFRGALEAFWAAHR